ncbi:RHS repeat domain-containing protein [Pirellulaceae bacterium SH467]
MSNYGFTSAGTSYDDEDRLTGFARASGTFTQSWSLTSVGDWNSITTNGTAQNRTHGPTHLRHLCPDCSLSSSSLSPPASGLLPDFDNKLKSADVDNNGSNDVTFQYDALGRRVARQGTSGSFVYVQHDQQTIADYGYGDAPSSPTHRYVYASYIDEPVVRKAAGTSGTIHYYQSNQQYSITAVTTSLGSVAERYAYTAYGQPTILDGSGSVLSSSAINNRYTYTGREWDQTLGLYHFRARWMSGLAGRFMGRDPIGYWDGSSLVVTYFVPHGVDPSGLDFIFTQPSAPQPPIFLSPFPSVTIPPGTIDLENLVPSPPTSPLPPIVGPVMGCIDLATVIDWMLSTDEEKRLWRHFVAGSGGDLNLSETETCAAIGSAMGTASAACMTACKGKSSGRTPLSIPIDEVASSPWSAGIGGFSTRVGCHCKPCYVSLDACIADPYDFDPRYFSTHRTLPAEVKTMLVAMANGLLDCGWRTFTTRGCCVQDLMTTRQ